MDNYGLIKKIVLNGFLWTPKTIQHNGDITPHTTLGKGIASFMMLLGWGILAVPTGIVTAEMTARRVDRRHGPARTERACAACGSTGHEAGAHFCKDCGAELPAAPARR